MRRENSKKKIEEVRNQIVRIEEVFELIPADSMLWQYSLGFLSTNFTLLFKVADDYEKLKVVLHEIRSITGIPTTFNMHFESDGNFVFVWDTTAIQVWFICAPDKIPEALMNSETCKVVEVDVPSSKRYSIVCGIKGGK